MTGCLACSRSVGVGAGACTGRMLFALAVPLAHPAPARLPTRGQLSASGCACRTPRRSRECAAAAGAGGLRHGRRGAGAGRAGRLGGRPGARRGRRHGRRCGGARRRRARGRGRSRARPGRRRPAPAAAQRSVAVDHLRARARAAAEQGHAVRSPRPPALDGVVCGEHWATPRACCWTARTQEGFLAGLHAPCRAHSGSPGPCMPQRQHALHHAHRDAGRATGRRGRSPRRRPPTRRWTRTRWCASTTPSRRAWGAPRCWRCAAAARRPAHWPAAAAAPATAPQAPTAPAARPGTAW